MTSVSYPMSDPFAASRYPSPPFSPSPADSPPLNIDGPIAPPLRQRPASTHITPFVPPLSPPSESQMPAGGYPAPLHSSAQSASTNSNARKRQSHNPSALPSESPPKAATPEYVLHPSIAAYQSAHPRRPLVGFGPYILLQTLGEGEFGKVKLGVQTEYGEEVAVKLIRRGSVDNEARLSKVEREIEVLKVSGSSRRGAWLISSRASDIPILSGSLMLLRQKSISGSSLTSQTVREVGVQNPLN